MPSQKYIFKKIKNIRTWSLAFFSKFYLKKIFWTISELLKPLWLEFIRSEIDSAQVFLGKASSRSPSSIEKFLTANLASNNASYRTRSVLTNQLKRSVDLIGQTVNLRQKILDQDKFLTDESDPEDGALSVPDPVYIRSKRLSGEELVTKSLKEYPKAGVILPKVRSINLN